MKELKITETARKNIRRLFSQRYSVNTLKHDPELTEIFDNFAYDESLKPTEGPVLEKTRVMCILASTIGCGSHLAFRNYVDACLNVGVKPREIREVVYQAMPYVGFNYVIDLLPIMNEVFENNDIKLPLDPQSTTTPDDRMEKGRNYIDEVFGKGTVDNMYETCPKGQEHIIDYLQGYCYGDYYRRNGIDAQHRELMTFCFLASLGGCPNQMESHAVANKNTGTSKTEMVAAVTAMLPYIGFPRSLQALNAINKAYEHHF